MTARLEIRLFAISLALSTQLSSQIIRENNYKDNKDQDAVQTKIVYADNAN